MSAQTLNTLHSFDGTDGSLPRAQTQATNGYLYGATYSGGANSEGTVYKITLSGTLTTLYSFGSMGSGPEDGPLQASDGNFYGTTVSGGTSNQGTVYKITPTGALSTLYNFCSQSGCADGEEPYAAPVQATDGNLYGTTCGSPGSSYGTVFKITPSGILTTLHSFSGTDGNCPEARLVQASDGNLYGTTAGYPGYSGTIFKISLNGAFRTLYTFCLQSGCTDGDEYPSALVQASDGNFYGTNSGFPTSDGTVFSITPSGTLTTLHSFDGTDGSLPAPANAGLVQATDGNFYGTTELGGANNLNLGTLFKVTPSGTLTTLYSFDGAHGSLPSALLQDTNGKFYGTTNSGGANGDGTVFSLSVGLGPFVETQPASGKVGAAVKILGTALTGATSVTFNGTATTFTVSTSGTYISTTVPTGATTGKVQVVTPGRTLSSNVVFRVLP
jgi:uncharacterized repeat protein (TIGR03803 family)